MVYMQKKDRQGVLLSLVASEWIGSQSALASRLKDEGFSVTQASVSRDLYELGVVKTQGRYSLPPRMPSMAEFGPVTFDKAGPNLIVGRCSSGLASAITVRVDAADFNEVVGTIAGDDTIFIAVKDDEAQNSVIERLTEMFG